MPLLDNNLRFENVTETATKPLVAYRATLEFLSDCPHSCVGCYVNRTACSYTEKDLVILEDIIRKTNNTGMLFDELTFGPVDFFTAKNSMRLLKEPTLKRIFSTHNPIFAVVTTLCSSNDTINEYIDEFNTHYSNENFELELQIVLDERQIFDPGYIRTLKSKIKLFDRIIGQVCYTLSINVHTLTVDNLINITSHVASELGTHVDINPSFFRSNKTPETKIRLLNKWNRMLDSLITKENMDVVTMPQADISHEGYNYQSWIFSNGYFYISPFIHGVVADTHENFRVDKAGELYEVSDLDDCVRNNIQTQIEYLPRTLSCSSCDRSSACISHHVISYMKHANCVDCILPKQALDLYYLHQYPAAVNSTYDWSTYTTSAEIATGSSRFIRSD